MGNSQRSEEDILGCNIVKVIGEGKIRPADMSLMLRVQGTRAANM